MVSLTSLDMGRGKQQVRQFQMVVPKPPKPSLSRTAFARHSQTIERFSQHNENGKREVELNMKELILIDTVHEQRRACFLEMLRLMRQNVLEREKRFYKLPERAYEGELRFFDSESGLRNVPSRKKKKPVFPIGGL